MWSTLRSFQDLALLEASRLEEEGDMAGAWTWYRAAIRAPCHLGLHGPTFARTSPISGMARSANGWAPGHPGRTQPRR